MTTGAPKIEVMALMGKVMLLKGICATVSHKSIIILPQRKLDGTIIL